ncbi:uncharacterized protein B0P05DRAFT_541415 [Gilbertella persicaria]|uniref:uncharacterized protein n=1 Tax=Gilbertella persicaria TaxID=101096 RepID=UPI00221F0D85|nr:uncharacterized protein B0P05DRAFT_541415 [Gilbertella persicaria]KAI8079639.1 hypothetical protein B0P05DRAFT_541415 [Gilbertella persicaria]
MLVCQALDMLVFPAVSLALDMPQDLLVPQDLLMSLDLAIFLAMILVTVLLESLLVLLVMVVLPLTLTLVEKVMQVFLVKPLVKVRPLPLPVLLETVMSVKSKRDSGVDNSNLKSTLSASFDAKTTVNESIQAGLKNCNTNWDHDDFARKILSNL